MRCRRPFGAKPQIATQRYFPLSSPGGFAGYPVHRLLAWEEQAILELIETRVGVQVS